MTLPEAALISWRTVDVEIVPDNRDFRLASLHGRSGYDRLNAGTCKAQRRKPRPNSTRALQKPAYHSITRRLA